MFINEGWGFLLELEALPGEVPEVVGMVPVDLAEEDDRGDVEPYRDVATGELRCTLGVEPNVDDDNVRRRVAKVWEYRDGEPAFNGKFPWFREVPLAVFVRRLLDANKEFDGFTEDDVAGLKEAYGV